MDSVGVLMKNLTIRVEDNKSTDVVEEEEMHEKSQQIYPQDSIITESKMEIIDCDFNNSDFNNSHQQKSSDGGDEFYEEVQEIYRQR